MKKHLVAFSLLYLSSIGVNAQSYCAAGPTQSFDSEITGVVLLGDNYSISQLSGACGPTGVQNFTLSDSADVSLGTSYALDVTMGTCGGSYAGAISAWIDFNGDGDFDDAGEQLGVYTGTPTVTKQWTFTVPTSAVLGQTVLRVMQEEGGNAGISPCNTFSWGSVEDYRIDITNTPPPCPNPSNLSVSTGVNDAALSWDGSANYYIVEYAASGFTPGTGDTVWVSTDTVFLTNLLSSTSYDFYVTAFCTIGPSVASASAMNVFTQCGIVTAPYTENFDGWSGNVPPCWNGIKTSTTGLGWTWDGFGTGSSGTGPSSGNSGDYYLYLETTGSSPSGPYFAELPVMDLTGTPNAQLKFAYHMFGATMGSLKVQVSTNNTNWTTIFSRSGQQQSASSDPYIIQTLSLANHISATTYIRFRGQLGSSFTGDMAIDDIYVGDCPGPDNVSVVNLTGNSATISWTSGAPNHIIEYGLTGFGQGTGMILAPATSPATITGLTGSTSYDFYIKDSCGVANVTIAGPFHFTTPQSIFSLPYYEDFENGNGDYYSSGTNNTWEYGTPAATVIPNASSGTQAWVTNLDGDYNSNESSTLYTPYFDNTAGSFDLVYEFDMALATEFFDKTWIEYSFNDVLWTKLTEGVISNNWYTDTQNQWWSGDNDASWKNRLAIVPNSAGKTVHFRHRFTSDAFFQREGVGIDEMNVYEIPCDFPIMDLAYSNVTTSSFDLHWTSNASSWEIVSGPVGFGQATGLSTILNVTNDSVSMPLGVCDSVDVYVRALCGGAAGSPWAGPITIGAPCEHDLRLKDLLVAINTCGDTSTVVEAVVENRGLYNESNFTVNTDLSGGLNSAMSFNYMDTLLPGETDTVMVGDFNSIAGATNVDIVGYTTLSNDQFTSNDSLTYTDVGYIGSIPKVASNDTICSTDPFGVLHAEPFDGLTFGWYASPTDTVATATGDSFVVANPGQLTWYLGYEEPTYYLQTNLAPNNGLSTNGSGVAFSITPSESTPITGFDLTTYATIGSSVTVWVSYLANTALTASNWNSANWVYVDTVTVTYTGNWTNFVLNKPFTIPGGVTSSLRIQTSEGIRYKTGANFGTVWAQNNELTIYQGLSFGSLTGAANNPRNFTGRIHYKSGGKCSDTLVPVSVEYYQDTAFADFTYTLDSNGKTVFFDATNSFGDVYSWDFGDGTNGTGDTITHVFADSGDVYQVCLTVDESVCMTSDTKCDNLRTTVGLEEMSLASNVKLYPNPSTGNFNVSFTTAVESDYQIEIVDITGRTVNAKTGETKYGENEVLFDADLPDGVYMVKVIVEGDVSTSRLVIRS
jgi:hypothetical protein